MGSKTNIWGTTVVSMDAALLAACDVFAATDGEIARAVDGDEFSGQELLALGQAAAVEYVEKTFSGPAMDDSIDWASV